MEKSAERKLAQTFLYLHDRWKDESEHEDWGEYEQAFRKALPEGAALRSFTSEPFKAAVIDSGLTYIFSMKRTSCEVKVIA